MSKNEPPIYIPKDNLIPYVKVLYEVFRMHVKQVDSNWQYGPHTHNIFEFISVLEGTKTIVMNDSHYELFPGDLIIIPPGMPHTSHNTSSTPMTYFCIHFIVEDTIILSYLKRICCMIYNKNSLLSIKTLDCIHEIAHLCTQSTYVNTTLHLRIHSATSRFFCELLDVLLQECTEINPLSLEKINLVTEMMYYLQDQLSKTFAFREKYLTNPYYQKSIPEIPLQEEIGIPKLAKTFNISESYCYKLFTQITNLSPKQYISSIKLSKSKSLLLLHSYSIEEISFIIGYSNVSNFSKTFKNWTGCSPQSFQKEFNR